MEHFLPEDATFNLRRFLRFYHQQNLLPEVIKPGYPSDYPEETIGRTLVMWIAWLLSRLSGSLPQLDSTDLFRTDRPRTARTSRRATSCSSSLCICSAEVRVVLCAVDTPGSPIGCAECAIRECWCIIFDRRSCPKIESDIH